MIPNMQIRYSPDYNTVRRINELQDILNEELIKDSEFTGKDYAGYSINQIVHLAIWKLYQEKTGKSV
ncbi:hypothetical protein ACNQFZ_06690 [Schinkia sp. CFF1]